MNKLRLEIGPVIRMAEELRARVERELPGHTGLAGLAAGAATAAREAERVSRQLKRPFGLHRLPATFLLLALVALMGWIYITFFRTSTLTIALPDRDAQELRTHVTRASRVQFRPVLVPGSREAAAAWRVRGKPTQHDPAPQRGCCDRYYWGSPPARTSRQA